MTEKNPYFNNLVILFNKLVEKRYCFGIFFQLN
eukprot:CAMPEP_0204845428 /NCGR_PEP_ID=MMETSP1347-20130617/1168_1 /ASSEMBLY_ACC=CAM_ASM_000690 /TAXON_ID=215587 /ORGANISM="Aplanochytrium stocchinoi, Strain GSBS06" /LENGTH=32 /DNA_ID= /DNA_START= /DNA_END= /DNA_ORIENTATION=